MTGSLLKRASLNKDPMRIERANRALVMAIKTTLEIEAIMQWIVD